MPLRTIDPPLQAFEAVRAKLADLATLDGFRTPALRRADTDAIALSTPHRTALLRLDRIKGAADLRRAAEPKGWRFLLHEGDRVIAAVEAQEVKGQHRFGQVNEGPFTTATEQAIRRAEGLDQVKRGRYTPTFLLAPAIYVAALWLQDEAGEADLVIPLAPAPPELTPMEPIAVRAFLAVLAKLAARVPAEDRRTKDPSGG